MLLGEQAVLTIASMPIGFLGGWALSLWIARQFDSEVYRIPLTVAPWAVGWASIGVVAAAVASGLVVRRRLDRLDLVAVLKTQE